MALGLKIMRDSNALGDGLWTSLIAKAIPGIGPSQLSLLN
jgi:hypothetical protein